jgi:hypothetical protein
VSAHAGVAVITVYVAGVLWSLLKSDARPSERVVLSLLWPLGPLAFLVTLVILLAASMIAYPLVMIPALALVALFWWAIR